MAKPNDTSFSISIHALREEGDSSDSILGCFLKFLSTPSARRATAGSVRGMACESISIHALREEGDRGRFFHVRVTFDFYPRPPRGGRHPYYFAENEADTISIHALREEGDSKDRDKISIFL